MSWHERSFPSRVLFCRLALAAAGALQAMAAQAEAPNVAMEGCDVFMVPYRPQSYEACGIFLWTFSICARGLMPRSCAGLQRVRP